MYRSLRTSMHGSARRIASATVLALGVTAAIALTGSVVPASASNSTERAPTSQTEETFASRLNTARASRGVPRLALRADLVRVARLQAARMAARSTLFHNPHLTTEVTNWRWVGENVGYGPDGLTVHAAFMASPAHRANILDPDYTELGIGTVTVSGRVWVAEVFRRPVHVTREASRPSFHRFTSPLATGSRGPDVALVQRQLGVPTTAVYGPATRRAVTLFQQRQGWPGSGAVGPKTWHLLS